VSNPFTELRVAVTESLIHADIPAYASPQATTPVPSVTVSPGNPYAQPLTLNSYETTLLLTVSVQAFDSAASLQVLEDLAFRCLKALPPGVSVSEVDAPNLVSLGDAQGKVYQTVITITAQVKESN
jgi:hypothetical protein